MKINVITPDQYITFDEDNDVAEVFTNELGQLCIMDSESRPVCMFASGAWNSVFIEYGDDD